MNDKQKRGHISLTLIHHYIHSTDSSAIDADILLTISIHKEFITRLKEIFMRINEYYTR